MDEIKQSQKAGEGSNLIQARTLNVNNTYVGITEQRAREIFSDEMAQRANCLAVEAQDVATKRMLDLFSDLIARVKKCEKDLSSFSDPGFLQNVRIAQESAAVSERKEDIETLSELLLARMNGKLKRSTKTGLRKAIEIVPELEGNEVTALAAMFFYSRCHLTNMYAVAAELHLAALDNNFSAILSASDLPSGPRWIQHLSILDCVEVNHIGSFKKMEDYYAEDANGIICVGIAKDSAEHLEAIKILNEYGIDPNMLVMHDLLSEYVRLPIVKLNDFSTLPLVIPNIPKIFTMTPSEKQKEGLAKVIKLYSNDKALLKKVKSAFVEKIAGYSNLNQFKTWLSSLKHSFELTPIGEALAYVNARRCMPGLPIMELE